MTDKAYAVRITRATDLDQIEDFIAALERAGLGEGNDIGRMKKTNRFPAGAAVVLFTADHDRIEACFHEHGFTAGVEFALLEDFATKDYGDEGAEIVGFESVSWESDEPVTPEQVFDQVRTQEGWGSRSGRKAGAVPAAAPRGAPARSKATAAKRKSTAAGKKGAKTRTGTTARKAGATKRGATKTQVRAPKRSAAGTARRTTKSSARAPARKPVRTTARKAARKK